MFTVEQLEKKVAELTVQVEQSAANHHILLGSKMTWESVLADAKKVGDIVAAVDPALAPEVVACEQVADMIEQVMN